MKGQQSQSNIYDSSVSVFGNITNSNERVVPVFENKASPFKPRWSNILASENTIKKEQFNSKQSLVQRQLHKDKVLAHIEGIYKSSNSLFDTKHLGYKNIGKIAGRLNTKSKDENNVYNFTFNSSMNFSNQNWLNDHNDLKMHQDNQKVQG